MSLESANILGTKSDSTQKAVSVSDDGYLNISIQEGLEVPAQNSTANATIVDAIGNKTDYIPVPYQNGEPSIMAYLHTSYYHVHGTSFVFPNLAAAVTATKSATEWAEGTAVELIAADATAHAFDIHFCVINDISSNGQYQLNLYASDTTLIGSIVFSRSANFSQEAYVPVQIPQQPAGTKITAKLAGSGTGTSNCGIKLVGHYYIII